MIVYVIESQVPYEPGEIIGVYSTESVAQAIADRHNETAVYHTWIVYAVLLDKEPEA